MLKALGDNTRYAIYLELARSAAPLSTAAVAEALDLHPNTVRPHLERMRDVGLLDVRPSPHGGVGRPQNLYSLAPDAPSLGLEPPVHAMLARMLLQLAAEAGLRSGDAAEAGRAQGAQLATRYRRPRRPCVEAAVAMLGDLGFDPERLDEDGVTTVVFTHCPFQELAESNPELVCSLHRGMLEGFVDAIGEVRVTGFHDRAHREPCLALLDPGTRAGGSGD